MSFRVLWLEQFEIYKILRNHIKNYHQLMRINKKKKKVLNLQRSLDKILNNKINKSQK